MKKEQIRERFEKEYGKPRKLKIKELGVEIYYRPITIEDAQHLKIKFKDLVVDELTWNLEAIFHKALDEDGKRIWTTDEDREFLRKNVDGAVMTKIINALTGGGVEEAKKKSKKTPS